MYGVRFEGVTTLTKALERNVQRIPNNDFLGTRVGDAYEWITWRDAVDRAKHLSLGIKELDLAKPI